MNIDITLLEQKLEWKIEFLHIFFEEATGINTIIDGMSCVWKLQEQYDEWVVNMFIKMIVQIKSNVVEHEAHELSQRMSQVLKKFEQYEEQERLEADELLDNL